MNEILESIFSDGSSLFVSNPLPSKGERITIYIRHLHTTDDIKLYLRTKIDGAEQVFPMKYHSTSKNLDYYSVDITCYENCLHYVFYILFEGRIYFYNQKGITDYLPSEAFDFRILYDYEQPEWVKSSVFYQIFPDRFCNGDPNNDVQTDEYTFEGYPTKHRDWEDRVLPYEEGHCLDFYGGDLKGIEDKIPYLKELGVTALYLNPIFFAATTHRYDCLDYFMVDPHLGGDEALIKLTEALHQNGMKIILDVSINHTGTANRWFNKDAVFFPKNEGAYNNPDSKERKYYFFDEHNRYKSWHDVSSLPTLNYTSAELRKKIFEGEDCLVKKWLLPPYHIDGWRFDVADVMARNKELQLHHEVWPAIRKSIKQVHPQAYILGEDWTDCTEFLNGNEWDSAMNYYGVASPIRAFIGVGDALLSRYFNKNVNAADAKMTKNRIIEYYARLPYVIVENQFNLLDSHDIDRLHNNKDVSFDDYKTAVIALFIATGAPSIYYGDEATIDGRKSNEGCRYPMPWKKNYQTSLQYQLYQTLAHLKLNEKALKYGSYQLMDVEEDILLWIRFTKEEGIIGILSRNQSSKKISIPIHYFGFTSLVGDKDLLGTKIKVQQDKLSLNIVVEPHTSLLIKVI